MPINLRGLYKYKCYLFILILVMGYDIPGGETERPVRFNGENFLQFKHRFGRR